MTAIVGLVDDGVVWVAGDSGSFKGWSRHTKPNGKVFKVKECIIGLSGRAVDAQLIEHHLEVPAIEDYDVRDWAIKKFVPALRGTLKGNGRVTLKDGCESWDSEFLLGVRDRLFRVSSDFYVAERGDGYEATGCGEEFALGSLFDQVGPPAMRLYTALCAAAYFSAGVHPPFTYKNSRGEGGTLTGPSREAAA